MATETTFTLAAADGHPLAATRFMPDGAPLGVVLLVSAMGVDQRYYAPFAQWLAGQGWQVLTFDYRGSGASRRGGLRGFRADIVDWAQQDAAALLHHADQLAQGKPVLWIGHSLGGQILGLVPNLARAQRVLTIASGNGYWRDNAPALRRRAPLLWYGFAPVLTALCGYFPGKRLRMVGDLPAGVIRQWRRWCLHPDYVVGAEGEAVRQRYAAVATPITALSFSDDELLSRRSIERLHAFYTGALRTLQHYTPAELGVARIGHFGFFRAEFAQPLWSRLIAPHLRALAPASAEDGVMPAPATP